MKSRSSFLLRTFFAALAVFVFSHIAAAALPVSHLQAAIGVTALATFTPSLSGMLFTTPTTEVAAIAKHIGMHSKQLMGQILNGLDVVKDLYTDRTVSRQGKLLPKLTIEKGVQPLDPYKDRNNRKERGLSGRIMFVYDSMKLFYWVPDEWIDSYMSDMIVPGTKQIPFAAYVMEKEREKLAEEINNTFYLQKYAGNAVDWASGSTYSTGDVRFFVTDRNYYRALSSTNAGESPITHPAKWLLVNDVINYNGIGTIIANEITAGNITPIVTGAITSSNAIEKIEGMYRGMTEAHQAQKGVFWMSQSTYEKYLDNYRNKYTHVTGEEVGDKAHYVFGSNKRFQIKPATWMAGSGRVIIDINQNLRVGTNLISSPGFTNTVPTLHGVEGVAKWVFGSEICDLEVLYVNDQA